MPGMVRSPAESIPCHPASKNSTAELAEFAESAERQPAKLAQAGAKTAEMKH